MLPSPRARADSAPATPLCAKDRLEASSTYVVTIPTGQTEVFSRHAIVSGEECGDGSAGNLRNEPNFVVSALFLKSCRGWNGRVPGFGLAFSAGLASGFPGLEALQFAEGVAVVALGGVDPALEPGQHLGSLDEGLGELCFPATDGEADGLVGEDLPFNAAEAAEKPFAIDEGIDEHTLFGRSGLEAAVVVFGERLEFAAILIGEDLGEGMDGGWECAPAICLDLFSGSHRGGG